MQEGETFDGRIRTLIGGDGLSGDYLRSAANAIALEHALLAMLRCLCATRPDVAASVPCTVRAFAALLHDGDAEQRLAGKMTDDLASRLSITIEDWTRRQ